MSTGHDYQYFQNEQIKWVAIPYIGNQWVSTHSEQV